MAQEGTSLSAVEQAGDYTGATVTPSDPFANASMIVVLDDFETGSAIGGTVIQVGLQVSHDGTNWATAAVANGPGLVKASGCPGVSLRAVILGWGANVTSGSVTATVCGV